MRRIAGAVVVVLAGLLTVGGAPAAAPAADVQAGSAHRSGSSIEFVAAAGVANDLTITVANRSVTIADAAGRVTARSGCSQESPTEVSCSRRSSASLAVAAGDLDDAVHVTGALPGRLDGGPGSDVLAGGTAQDTLVGGEGTDTASYAARTTRVRASLDGQANDGSDADGNGDAEEDDRIDATVERLTGGAGADVLTGDDRVNVLTGGGGDDTLDGRLGADVLDGGAGADTATYAGRTGRLVANLDDLANDGADADGDGVAEEGDRIRTAERLVGGAGNDRLSGSSAANRVDGGGGADTLRGAAGDDAVVGGAGDDWLDGGTGADAIDGATGTDTVSYGGRAGNLVLAIDGAADDGMDADLDGAEEEHDAVATTVENVIGSPGQDRITGTAAANRIDGVSGDDVLDGAGGADTLIGGGGSDVADYGRRTAAVALSNDGIANDGTDAGGDATGEEGDNISASVEDLTGGAGDDRLTGNSLGNRLHGGPGVDRVSGVGGDDVLSVRETTANPDVVTCGSGADRVLADEQDIYAVLADCETRQVGVQRYGGQAFDAVDVTSDVPYGSAPQADGTPQQLLLDLYKPRGDTARHRPAVIWLHAGGFTAGDKTQSTITRFADGFAKLGYVTASVNYRLLAPPECLNPPFPGPVCDEGALAAQHDAQAAVRWLRAHAAEHGIDPALIAVGGYSAGATTAINLATRAFDPGASGTPGIASTVRAAISISGALRVRADVTSGDAPTAFFHGTADGTVPYDSALATRDAFVRAGVASAFTTLEGIAHDSPSTAYRPILDGASEFVFDQLGLDGLWG